MELDLDDRRQVIGLIVAAVLVMVVASIGFATFTQNPLRPDATLTADDAAQAYDLNRSGTVDMLVIEHTGGGPIRMENVDIILGSRVEGFHFNESGNWRYETADLAYAARLNGEPISPGATVEQGDRIAIAKVSGVGTPVGEVTPRTRVHHLPSQKMILDERVTVR